MPRRWTRRASRFAVAVAAFFAIYTGVFLVWNDEAIARSVSGWISASLKGRGGPTKQAFVIGRARYPYWGGIRSLLLGGPSWVEMWDTTIYDGDGNEVLHAPYARGQFWIGRVVWYMAWSAVTRREDIELRFANADVPQIRCRIANTSAGAVNLVEAMSARNPKPSSGGLRVRLDGATVHDGDFRIGFPGWEAEVNHIAAQATLQVSTFRADQPGPDRPDFVWEVTPLAARTAKLTLGSGADAYVFPMEELVASRFGAFRGREQDLAFVAKTRTRGAEAEVEGRLRDAHSKRPGVDLTIRFDHGAGLLRMLPTRELIVGNPRGEVRIHGPFSHTLIEGRAEGAELRLVGLVGRRLGASFLLDRNLLHVRDAGVAIGGGSLRGELEIDFQRLTLSGDLTAERVDPGTLQPLVPPALRPWVAGRAAGRFHIETNLADHPERIRVRQVDLRLARRGIDALPRELSFRGGLRLAPEKIRFDDLTVGGDGVVAKLLGDVALDGLGTTATVSLTSASLRQLLTRLGLDGLHAEGVASELTVGGTLFAPLVDGRLRARGIAAYGYQVPEVGARVRFARGRLEVRDLTAGGALGSTLTADLALDLYAGDLRNPLAAPVLDLRLASRGLPLAAVARGPFLTGVAVGSLQLRGALGHLDGGLDVELPSLALYGDPYRNGVLRVAVRDGALELEKLAIARENGGMIEARRGTLSRSGDLDAEFDARDFPLAAIPQLRELGPILAGTLSGRVRITAVEGRWSAAGAIGADDIRVRDINLGNGSLRLTPQGDLVRLAGEFFRRFNVDGTLRLSPAIGLRVKIRFDDYPLEDLIPALRKLPEVHTVVSGSATIAFDVVHGLTFAELRLDQVLLALTGEDEDDSGDGSGAPRSDVFRNVGDVIITTDGAKLTFVQARLRSRIGQLEVRGDLSAADSDLSFEGQVELGLLAYFFSSAFQSMHGEAVADLRIRGPAARPDVIGTLDISRAELKPRGIGDAFVVPGGRVVFERSRVGLDHFRVRLDNAEAVIDGNLGLRGWEPSDVSLDLRGALSPTLLVWAFPDHVGEATGRVRVEAKVSGTWPELRLGGRVDVDDLFFREKRLGRDLRISSGSILLDGTDLVLGCPVDSPRPGCRSLVGKIDEVSDVRLDGLVGVGRLALGRVDLHLEGKDLEVGSPGVYAVTVSPSFDLYGDGEGMALSGTLTFVAGRYQQNFEYQNLVFKPRVGESEPPFYEGTPLLEDLALDLTAVSSGPLNIKNNLADVNVTVPGLTISGTLSDPTLNGVVLVEEGGRFTIPFLRAEFVSDKGSIQFVKNKRFPRETPRLSLNAWADWQDRYEQLHRILLVWRGTLLEPDFDLSSTDGWNKNQVLLALATGGTEDQIRRAIGTTPGARATGAGADTAIKQIVGDVVDRVIGDPLKSVFKLDVARIELGSDSVMFRLCPWATRNFKLCGTGDVGFVTSTRYNASGELKLSDAVSLLGAFERVERGLDTSQDTVSRFKFQLILRYPR